MEPALQKKTRHNMFDEILKDLEKIRQKIEALDDPAAKDYERALVVEARYYIEECIRAIDVI